MNSSASPAVSVIACTHNPRAEYFSRCLNGLRAQTLDPGQWELIVVDNVSTPGVAGRFDLSGLPSARVIVESSLGLTPARLRGIRESRGRLLVFVDDDNVLDPGYLETAVRVAAERPHLGAWSGQCRPAFEVPPPEWTRRYWGNLVIREFDRDVWSNLPRLATTMPCGAGLCVRRDVAMEYVRLHDTGRRSMMLDRQGTSLLSGGDNDLAACACDVGLGVGLIASLGLTHLIPPERMTLGYLTRLLEGIFFSAVVLAHARGSTEELEAYAVRWHEPIRMFLTRGPHRQIRAAVLRGRRRGLRSIGR